MSQIKYLSKDILAALNRKYPRNRCKYKLSNAFIFKDDWETDFFVQKINYYCYEFEIKVSRADFNRDKLKIDKHKILKDGNYTRTIYKNRYQKETSIPYGEPIRTDIIPHTILPNKFYYVVPKEMIKVEEIPKYAGLIYFDGYNLETVKEADFIHKNKLEFEKILCNKFYNYWLNLKQKMDIGFFGYYKRKGSSSIHITRDWLFIDKFYGAHFYAVKTSSLPKIIKYTSKIENQIDVQIIDNIQKGNLKGYCSVIPLGKQSGSETNVQKA